MRLVWSDGGARTRIGGAGLTWTDSGAYNEAQTASATISGALSATLRPATLAATAQLGTLTISGSLNASLRPATLAAAGRTTTHGTLNIVLRPVSLSGTAQLPIRGALSASLAGTRLSSQGWHDLVTIGEHHPVVGSRARIIIEGDRQRQISLYGARADRPAVGAARRRIALAGRSDARRSD